MTQLFEHKILQSTIPLPHTGRGGIRALALPAIDHHKHSAAKEVLEIAMSAIIIECCVLHIRSEGHGILYGTDSLSRWRGHCGPYCGVDSSLPYGHAGQVDWRL